MSANLPRYTWDEAAILRLATARGFQALRIQAATVRGWASEGLITSVGKAPGGAHLYSIEEVSAVAARPRRTPGPTRRGAAD
jgi:hypothetical protein